MTANNKKTLEINNTTSLHHLVLEAGIVFNVLKNKYTLDSVQAA